MPYGYNVRSTSDAQSTAADNTTTQTVTPPNGATGMLLSVVTADIWVTFGGGTPSASLGHVVKKDTQPFLAPWGAIAFKWKAASASAAVLNITWLY